MLKAYSSRAFNGGNNDNREYVVKIVNLRLELSRLLGFENFAEMILGDRMADTPGKVFTSSMICTKHPNLLP